MTVPSQPDIVGRNIGVRMVREDLADVPNHPVPPGYSVRWYRPGDERLWVQIHERVDKYNAANLDLFWKEFGRDPDLPARRQCFLCDADDAAVGTVTAWFDNDYRGRRYGRLHWLALVPEVQGRGLSKPLVSLTCRRMRELGHDRAYLMTSTARLPAINLYLQFGFVPDISSPDDLSAWRELRQFLKRPLDLPEIVPPVS